MNSIKMQKFESLTSIPGQWKVGFVGPTTDQRGKAAIELVSQSADKVSLVEYSRDEQHLLVDGHIVQCHELQEFVNKNFNDEYLFEATTLGIPEIALLFNAIIKNGTKIGILYIEPGEYSQQEDTEIQDRVFQLSDRIHGYEGIPTLAREIGSSDFSRVVFFVGFESARLQRAFEDQPINPRTSSLVFGVPPYKPGWEANSLYNNIRCLSEKELRTRIYYCPADNPQSVIDRLETLSKTVLHEGILFVAPIGTKPQGIGALIYQAMNKDKVSILYDHPVKSPGRSRGVGAIHFFELLQ